MVLYGAYAVMVMGLRDSPRGVILYNGVKKLIGALSLITSRAILAQLSK